MEFGEIDLAHMLQNQQTHPFDLHFIGLYWRQVTIRYREKCMAVVVLIFRADQVLIPHGLLK